MITQPIGFRLKIHRLFRFFIFLHSHSHKGVAVSFHRKGGKNGMAKRQKSPQNAKVIALANQKGGTAKTTLTVNPGIGLANQGKRMLLVDADPQGDLTTALGWTDADTLPVTLTTQMERTIRDEPFDCHQGILHHNEGVDLVSTNIELSGMETTLVNVMSREFTLKNYPSGLKKEYLLL